MTGNKPFLRAPIAPGPDMAPVQADPSAAVQAPRTDYRSMIFDRDGYALTHNRNLFAASMWLSELIDAEAQWPEVAGGLRDHLDALGHTVDHIDQQIFAVERLVAPWLNSVRKVGAETHYA